MRILVTGSAGHLGEALIRELRVAGHAPVGMDILAGPWTDRVGSVADRGVVRTALDGIEAVIHAATLHKPHIGSHSRSDFVDTNVTGTLNLLEEAVAANVSRFLYLSTTSVFGRALRPGPNDPAAWVTERLAPLPRNIYGVTKLAAEDLCELVHRDHGMPVLVLRTSRFFPEDDDDPDRRGAFEPLNLKVNELLYRRVDISDLVEACSLALARAPDIGFGRYVISATTPFTEADTAAIRTDLPSLVAQHFPDYAKLYASLRWRLPDGIGRVYVNAAAKRDLGWEPRFNFGYALERLAVGADPRSDLALTIGKKGYHAEPHDVYTSKPRSSFSQRL
jgi:UDP-glucose 4-epimerase